MYINTVKQQQRNKLSIFENFIYRSARFKKIIGWKSINTLSVTAFTGGMVGVYKGLRGAIFGSEVEDV